MEILLDLMQRKNSFLEKFYTINEAELLNFSSGDFRNLESFYQCRENLLRLIGRLDDQIDDTLKIVEQPLSTSAKTRIQQCLQVKDDWARKIVDQDLQIISCIERKKSGIITELKSVQQSKKMHTAYQPEKSNKPKLSEKA